MKHYSRLTPLLLLVFAGCAQVKDDSPTLKSLERRNISVEKDTTIPDSRSKAIEQYQSIAGTANDKSVQREAKRKIADLEVDNAESIFLGKIKKSQQDAQTSAPPPLRITAMRSICIRSCYRNKPQNPTLKTHCINWQKHMSKAVIIKTRCKR